MDWPTLILIPLRLALLLAGLLVPGWLVLRAFALPRSPALAFLTSAAVLYLGVVGLALTHSPITLVTLAAAPACACLGAAVWAGRRAAPAPTGSSGRWAWLTGSGPWLPLLLLVVAVLVYRLAVEPLSGPDVRFRWSYLAEQMLRYRTLDFYPVQSAEDYLRYFWPESIPPGIASLYAWSYACAGSTSPAWTIPVVALELMALFELVHALAANRGSPSAGRHAVLLAAACPVLLWTYLLGQETGLLATAVVGLAWSLERAATTHEARCLVAAKVCAVVAASTREYGFMYALAAVAVAFLSADLRPRAWRFTVTVLPLAAAWPLYCWFRTGNPFYSLGVGGLFPVNSVFAAWNHDFLAGQQSAFHALGDWYALARYLILWALPPCLGAAALAWLAARKSGRLLPLTTLIGLSIVLWALSVPRTAGGLFYSLRVLSPAFALLCAAAALGLERLPAGARRVALAALVVVLFESVPKTIVLPQNPYNLPVAEWAYAGRKTSADWHRDEDALIRQIAALPVGAGIASDNFDIPALARRTGRQVSPLWTPALAWFFDASLSPAEAARRWRDSGIRVLVVGRTGPTLSFLHRAGRWTIPGGYALRETGGTEGHVFLTFEPAGPDRP